MNLNLFFSDGTREYRNPVDVKAGDDVTVRFRVPAGCHAYPMLHVKQGEFPMTLSETGKRFDYYTATIHVDKEQVWYYFSFICEGVIYQYDRSGVTNRVNEEFFFRLTPGFDVPEWAKGAVMYQIYTDRFCNGDKSNDVVTGEYVYLGTGVEQVEKWNTPVADLDVGRFYGGDLAGVRKKLDYLQDLGVEVIYFNPLFVSPSNHKYDSQDYDYIDPHFGVIVNDGKTGDSAFARYIKRTTDKENLEASNAYFADLVKEIHARGMKVILDGVFNHCGSFNKWLDREGFYAASGEYEPGAYQSKESPYWNFFKFRNEDDKNSYEGWWGYETLPKLNFEESEELCDYICKVGAKWVSAPYNVDGWRLDVAADLGHSEEFNHKFWKRFRKAVKEAHPDAVILAEHYGNAASWLKGDEWDTVMNYDAFMEPVTWFLTGMEKHSYESNDGLYCNYEHFAASMNRYMTQFSTPSLQVAMNQLSNHDHSRFMTRTNRKVGRSVTHGPQAANEGIHPAVMREAVVMQFTWPGAPTIYYGDEVGMCGWTDPDNRRAYPWGFEDKALFRFHKEMIRLHKSYEALRTGSVVLLTGGNGTLSYGRFDRDDKFVVVVNNNSHPTEVIVPAWKTGILENEPLCSLLHTDEYGYGFEAQIYYLQDGMLRVPMPPYSAVVLKSIANLF